MAASEDPVAPSKTLLEVRRVTATLGNDMDVDCNDAGAARGAADDDTQRGLSISTAPVRRFSTSSRSSRESASAADEQRHLDRARRRLDRTARHNSTLFDARAGLDCKDAVFSDNLVLSSSLVL